MHIMSYNNCNAVKFMQAVAISKLMLPFLNGDEQQRKIYLKTMNNLSHQKKFWRKDIAGIMSMKHKLAKLSHIAFMQWQVMSL